MENTVHVTLTGGLGNQLFQLAAGLSLFEKPPITLVLDSGLGRPRRNQTGLPEIASFNFEGDFLYSNTTKNPRFSRKVNGYLLRMGITLKWYERNHLIRKALTLIGESFMRLYYKHEVVLVNASGLGFSELKRQGKTTCLNGYFQSYRYLETGVARSVMESMRLEYESEELREFKNLANTEKPLIVHLRFGDYEKEPFFGIPNDQYYKKAIDQAIRELDVRSIWVFSDDLSQAKKKIPQNLNLPIRWIDSIGGSTSETFELMKYGSHYVIANSSFSFWGAILSKNRNARVWAPWPWFENMPSPQDLLPPNWVTLNPWDYKDAPSK